jgi:hypothetical protein
MLLHDRVNAEYGYDDGEGKVEWDEEAVECATRTCKVPIEHAGHGQCCSIHARGRTDENPLPEIGVIGVLPVLETCLWPGMGEVYEKDQAKDDEDGGADEGNVVSPEYKETIGDEERYDNEYKPKQDLRSPPTAILWTKTLAWFRYHSPILDGCAFVTSIANAKERNAENDMEQRQGKADTVDLFTMKQYGTKE